MKRSSARGMRRLRRFVPAMIFSVVVMVLVAISMVFIRSRSDRSLSFRRLNIVLATSPVSVWSWDRNANTATIVLLPADTVIDATHGYGKYSLEAIWKIGSIEKKEDGLLSGSLSDALGVPIPLYFGEASENVPSNGDPVAYGKEAFSVRHIAGLLLGTYRTNIPLPTFIALTKAISAMHSSDITQIDLSRMTVSIEEELPDNSIRKVLDPIAVDAVLQGDFEDDAIREEAISVALFNTTQKASLGSRAARLLTNSGVLVVSVGNDEKEVSRCELEGEKSILETKTANFITSLFDCQKIPMSDQRHAELTVRIGSEFASMFQTQKAR